MTEKELKPRSFRIDDLTAERFRKIAEETGGNQQQSMSFLIDSYEMRKKREELPEKRDEISKMDEYLDVIRLKYLGSLADNVHQEEILRKKLAAGMEKQKEETAELKQKLQNAEQEKEAVAAELKRMTGELNQTRTDLQSAEKQLADKEKLNQELEESRRKLQESYISCQRRLE